MTVTMGRNGQVAATLPAPGFRGGPQFDPTNSDPLLNGLLFVTPSRRFRVVM